MTSMQLLTTKQVCDLFCITGRTLHNWRKNKSDFPQVIKLGGTNKYRQAEIENFINSLTSKVA